VGTRRVEQPRAEGRAPVHVAFLGVKKKKKVSTKVGICTPEPLHTAAPLSMGKEEAENLVWRKRGEKECSRMASTAGGREKEERRNVLKSFHFEAKGAEKM